MREREEAVWLLKWFERIICTWRLRTILNDDSIEMIIFIAIGVYFDLTKHFRFVINRFGLSSSRSRSWSQRKNETPHSQQARHAIQRNGTQPFRTEKMKEPIPSEHKQPRGNMPIYDICSSARFHHNHNQWRALFTHLKSNSFHIMVSSNSWIQFDRS